MTFGGGQTEKTEEVEKKTLVFMHIWTGGDRKRLYDEAIEEFKKEHPNVSFRVITMDAEEYVGIGLRNQVAAEGPPDIYRNWGGWRMGRYASEGYAMDLTPYLKENNWADSFVPVALKACYFRNKVYMVPTSMDWNMIWYNGEMFDQWGLSDPYKWEDFIDICEKIKENNVIPINTGNQQHWAAAAWAGVLQCRSAGFNAYTSMFRREEGTRFDSPDMVEGLKSLEELVRLDYFPKEDNGIKSDEAEMYFFQGQAAMNVKGNWIIGNAFENAPDFVDKMSCFRSPLKPEGKGDGLTVLGGSVGLMVGSNAEEHDVLEECLEYIQLVTSSEWAERWVREAGMCMPVKGVITHENSAPPLIKAWDLLMKSTNVINWQDRVYDEEMVEIYENAVAAIIDGSSAEEALRSAESKINEWWNRKDPEEIEKWRDLY